jgi:hypothetical protein
MKTKMISQIILMISLWNTLCYGAQIDPLKRHIIEGTYYMMVEGDLAKAEEEFASALKIDPQNPEAAFLLGRITFDRILKGDLPREKLKDAERLLRLAESQGIIHNRFHPDLLGVSRFRGSPPERISFWRRGTTKEEPPESYAVAVFEIPFSLGQVKLLSPDEEGYTRSRLCNPGDAIQLHSGVRYRVELERRTGAQSYAKLFIPIAIAAGVLWLTMR